MEIAIIVFIVLVGIMVIVTVTTTIMDIVKTRKKDKAETPVITNTHEEVVKEEVATKKEPAPTIANDNEQKEVIEVDPNAVIISKTTKTLDDKYKELSPKYKGFYDSLANYASIKPGAKQIKNTKQEVYKVGNSKLITLKIKRDTVIAEFLFENKDFKDFASDTNVKLKQTPTTIKIVDEEAVSFAKGSIDIAYEAVPEAVIKRQTAKKN